MMYWIGDCLKLICYGCHNYWQWIAYLEAVFPHTVSGMVEMEI